MSIEKDTSKVHLTGLWWIKLSLEEKLKLTKKYQVKFVSERTILFMYNKEHPQPKKPGTKK